MNINKKFVVYETNCLLENKDNITLKKVEFKGWTQNAFDTEEEAIQTLIDHKMTYDDYLILTRIYITT